MTRITQRAVNRTYKNAYSTNLGAYTDSMSGLETGRSFAKVSENVAGASRAFKIRKSLARDNQYLNNIADIKERYESAEDSLTSVNDYLQTVQDRMVQAQGTSTESEYKVIAEEIRSLAKSVIQSINNSTTDVFTFGSNQNVVPYDVSKNDTTGKYEVKWRDTGINVNDIKSREEKVYDDTTKSWIKIDDEDVYVDIGIGLDVKANADGSYDVDENSTVKASYSALDALGYGTDAETGYANNVISLLYELADVVESGDTKAMASGENFLNTRYKEFVVNLTAIGATTSYLEDCTKRMESEIDILTGRQQEVEAVDYASEIIDEQTFYQAYQITLQMGSKILPQSIFQFI